MSHLFSYGITLQEGGKVALFPAAELAFQTKEGDTVSLFLILDSGASISALPKSDAITFGIDVETGMPTAVAGIEGKPIEGWRHELMVMIGIEKISIPFLFLGTDDAPRILGREGIFDRYTVVFEETKRRTALLTTETQEAMRVTEALDSL